MRLPKFNLTRNANFVSFAVIGAAIVLLIAGVTVFVQQERQRVAINEQIAQTNKLIEEVKDLSETNKEINEENRNFAYCNAMLLARYTQNQLPIVIEDLNKCVLSSFPENETAPQNSSSAPAEPQQPTSSVERSPAATPSPVVTPPRAPVQPIVPTVPRNEAQSPEPLAQVPGLLELNLPCVNVLGLVRTCETP